MRMYSSLVERCFNSCCNDFTSKTLSSKEVSTGCTSSASRNARTGLISSCRTFSRILQEQCVMNCTDKFLKHSERVGARFAEQNAGTCLNAYPPIACSPVSLGSDCRDCGRRFKMIDGLFNGLCCSPISVYYTHRRSLAPQNCIPAGLQVPATTNVGAYTDCT